MGYHHRIQNRGSLIDGIVFLPPQEAHELLKSNAILVDVRKDYETNYRLFDVPNVIFLEESKFRDPYTNLPKGKNLIIADNVGIKSKVLCAFLREKGFIKTVALIGGIVAWAEAGLPMVVDRDGELAGPCSCKLSTNKSKKRVKK